jgi:hypothetical protein
MEALLAVGQMPRSMGPPLPQPATHGPPLTASAAADAQHSPHPGTHSTPLQGALALLE